MTPTTRANGSTRDAATRASAFIQESRDSEARSLDPGGIILFAASMFGLTWGLIYGQAQGWGPELAAALPPLLRPAARIVVESDRRAPIELPLALERSRRYGDTLITIHRQQ